MISSREFMKIATNGGRLVAGREPETRPTPQAFWHELAQYALRMMRGGAVNEEASATLGAKSSRLRATET